MKIRGKVLSAILIIIYLTPLKLAFSFLSFSRSYRQIINTILYSTTSKEDKIIWRGETVTLKSPIELDVEQDYPSMYDQYVQNTYSRYPITIISGNGCILNDSDNNVYLDCVSGIATCALGHNNPELTAAITNQMSMVHHVSNLYYTPPQAKLASWLTANSVADKVFFCNSGAEANEAAIKLARKVAFNRGITDPVIITALQSFHGRTLAALSATGQSKYHVGFGYGGEMVQGFVYVPYNDLDALSDVVKKICVTSEKEKISGRKRGVAAVMLETLQGEGGVIPGNHQYFSHVRQLCDLSSALLICDEVQIGMGRSGTLWGYEQLNIEPDIFTTAKALGGGIPIGAMCARGSDVVNSFSPGDHASTYGGNPLACSAALAIAQYFSDHHILKNVQCRGEELTYGLNKISCEYPDILGDVRGWGLLKGIQVKESSRFTASDIVKEAMNNGLLVVSAGPSVVRFIPPLIISEAQIKQALFCFKQTIKSLMFKGYIHE